MSLEQYNLSAINEMHGFMARIQTLVEFLEKNIAKLSPEHGSLASDIRVLRELVVELQTNFENYISGKVHDNLKLESSIKMLYDVVESLSKNMKDYDPEISKGNREILDELRFTLLNENSTIQYVTKLAKITLDRVHKELDEINIVTRNKNESIQPIDIIEVIKFAKRGNQVIDWVLDKKKAIIWVGSAIGFLYLLYSWWDKIIKVFGAVSNI